MLENIIKRFIYHAVMVAVAATCMFPIAWMVSCSFKTQEEIFSSMSLIPSSFRWQNYVEAWTREGFGIYFLNSAIYTIAGVAGIIIVAALAAYAFSRMKFPGKDVLFYVMIASLMVPIPGSFVPLYVVLKNLGLLDTRLGIILPYINGGLAFAIFLLRTFFDEMPKDLEDAARIDGANKLRIFIHVAMPIARPALAVVVIFNFLGIWNEFILANIVFNNPEYMPIQVGLFKFQGSFMTEYPLLMAGLVIASIPVLVVYFLMQKHIISGITSGAIKS